MHSFRGNLVAKSSALTHAKKANEKFLPFVTAYHPAVSNLKLALVEQWSLIQNQPRPENDLFFTSDNIMQKM